MQEQWEACRTAVAARMPDLAFNTWIKPLDFLGLDANECVLRLGAVTQFKADIVRNQYAELIQQVVREMIDPAVRVEIGVTPKAGGTGNTSKASATAGTGGHADVPAARAAPVQQRQPARVQVPQQAVRRLRHTRLTLLLDIPRMATPAMQPAAPDMQP